MTKYRIGLTETEHLGAPSEIWRFPNNYGASIVHHQYAYGGWELAVIIFNEDGTEFHITYDTDITDDVIGYISSEREEAEILQQIRDLPDASYKEYLQVEERHEKNLSYVHELYERMMRGEEIV